MKPSAMAASVRSLADSLARAEAHEARRRFSERAAACGLSVHEDAVELAAALALAYPALAQTIAAHPEDVVALSRSSLKAPRDARQFRRGILSLVSDVTDGERVRRALRRFARREKMRVAARELVPHGGDVNVTARELSDLADVCIDVALTESLAWAEQRFGAPKTAAGERCGIVVLGMGKLGGRELNAGSDVDLILFYETDDGGVLRDGVEVDMTLHEYFTRVAQRFVASLDELTEDGLVWRVDMRLRPEGARGPLVNALAAAERYYETWGRTWERAALLRARAVAGDVRFGARLLDALAPFVWRRAVDPTIAEEMHALVARARAELSADPERDLKHGVGGIREAEFFVQTLQLVWGGREPSVRSTNTLDALKRLRARGLVTDREGRELAEAYLTLRRLEHRIHFATGLQTHAIPSDEKLMARIARSLGYATVVDHDRDLDKVRRRVANRFASLRPRRGSSGSAPEVDPARAQLERLFVALDELDEAGVLAALPSGFGTSASPDVARHLVALARRADAPLGTMTREKFPSLGPVLVEALADAADPEQATRLLASFFARLRAPSAYLRPLDEDPRATRRLASLFGASAFLGQAMVAHPDLAEQLLFQRNRPDPAAMERALEEEIAATRVAEQVPPGADVTALDADAFVGALRRARWRAMMEVGLADLAGEVSTRECTLALSALADATLKQATRYALLEKGLRADYGLAVVAMGKLGGREIGYGSDLDVFFVYDDADLGEDAPERFARIAQRVLRLVSAPHGDGPGYELDTRLRPSGNQGLLVVSREGFARYHGVDLAAASDGAKPAVDPALDPGRESTAEPWERQALLKARFVAGDPSIGRDVLRVAESAAYERGAPAPSRVHHLRTRMERELAGERLEGRVRYDLKVGRGGLVDVEFAVQWLQMTFGRDPRVRTTDTETALAALEACGYIDPTLAAPLREGYRFLRRLEQRLRVLHGTGAQLLEEGAEGLVLLARRMGMRDGPRGSAADALVAHYRAVTRDVRTAYLAVLGLGESAGGLVKEGA
jgi:glutamate-ammonia-ligase adenylyltransferase